MSKDIAKGFLTKTLKPGGKGIKYAVYIPQNYDANTPMPTIVFLNGYGECGMDGLKQLSVGIGAAIMADEKAWPFVVIFPQKQDHNALWEDEDAMVMAILDKTLEEYEVDSSRLYLTGLSQGGHGTWAIGAKHPELFAAIAPICGWGDEEIAKKLVGMPIWAFHGEADTTVEVSKSQDMLKLIETAGGKCKLTTYPEVGHNSWDNAYRNEKLGEWFLKFHRLESKPELK